MKETDCRSDGEQITTKAAEHDAYKEAGLSSLEGVFGRVICPFGPIPLPYWP